MTEEALPPEVDARLREQWRLAQRIGLLGPGALEAHVSHTLGWARALKPPVDGRCLDLGSGAGVPGLALALCWASSRWVLLDSQQRRADFLRSAVDRLGLASRVEVVQDRAETLGRQHQWRAAFRLVVARCFAAPGITAECGAAFLVEGGRLVVSEPPGTDPDERWPPGGLVSLGLRRCVQDEPADGPSLVVLEQAGPYPEGLPRRPAAMARRPRF